MILNFTPIQTSFPITHPYSRTSAPQVNIAYFIMIHHKPDAFKEIFQKIYTRRQFYPVYIDRKTKAEFTEEITSPNH